MNRLDLASLGSQARYFWILHYRSTGFMIRDAGGNAGGDAGRDAGEGRRRERLEGGGRRGEDRRATSKGCPLGLSPGTSWSVVAHPCRHGCRRGDVGVRGWRAEDGAVRTVGRRHRDVRSG